MKALALKLSGALLLLSALLMWASRAPDWPVQTLVARWAPPPSQFIELDGQLVHLRDEGPRDDPEPLLLLHGLAGSLHTWEGWARALHSQHRVISVDLPGFGLTGPSVAADYSPQADQRFVLALLDRLGVQRVALGGNALGAELAWRTALLAPARVRRLILVAATGPQPAPAARSLAASLARITPLAWLFESMLPRTLVAAGLQRAYGDPARIDADRVDRSWQLLLRAGNRRALVQRLARQPAAPAPPDAAADGASGPGAGPAALRVPTLLLWGERDRITPPALGRQLAAVITGSRLVVFDGLGHLPQEEDAARTVQPVAAFLAR